MSECLTRLEAGNIFPSGQTLGRSSDTKASAFEPRPGSLEMCPLFPRQPQALAEMLGVGFAALAAESPAWLPDLLGKPTVPASSRWPGSLALETLTSSCKAHAFSRLLAAMAPTPTGSLAFPSPVKSIPNNKVIETPWVLFPYSLEKGILQVLLSLKL